MTLTLGRSIDQSTSPSKWAAQSASATTSPPTSRRRSAATTATASSARGTRAGIRARRPTTTTGNEPCTKLIALKKLNAINLKPATQYNNTVAVHARCSDVPFNKHPIYHLPAPSYWSWAIATLLKATSVREAIVHHNGRFGIVSGSRAGACNALARSMCDALLRAGFRSCILAPAMSDREAFEAMLGSAALLTTMPSSFSLLPGLSIATRNPTSFITPLFSPRPLDSTTGTRMCRIPTRSASVRATTA